MRIWGFLFMYFLLFSCQTQENTDHEMGSDTEQPPKKMFAGKPDLPTNDSEITSAGVGKVLLGSPLNGLDQLFDSVLSVTIYKSGGEWEGRKIVLTDGQYILAESVNAVNQITGIYTNSKNFKTPEGYSIGMSLDSLQLANDSIYVNSDQKSMVLYKSGIQFRINEAQEIKTPYTQKDLGVNLKNATITEFFIICGDC